MVAAATTSPLSPPDEAILTRLFEIDAPSLADLFKSLTQTHIDGAPQTLLDLFRWSHRPEIKAWLDIHASEQSAAIRRRRIAKLEQIADTSKDLVEQRRACTTVLRALDWPLRASRPSGAPSLITRAGASPNPSSPNGGGGRAAAGGGSVSPSPTHAPTSQREPSTPVPPENHLSSPPSHNPSSPAPSRGAATVTSPGREPWEAPPNPEAPEGRHSASPDDTTLCDASSPPTEPPNLENPDEVLELAISHIQTPRDPASIAALAGALAPIATINSSPVDHRTIGAALAKLPHLPGLLTNIDPPHIESTDTTITWSTTFTYAPATRTTFRLELTRIDTHWLISSLHHHLNSS